MMIITDAYSELIIRDLDRLYQEINEISEEDLWQTVPGVINSCGVMTQHLVGNLRHFIGAGLGKTGYERNRPKEFENTGLDKAVLLEQIEELKEELETVFDGLDEKDYEKKFPLKFPFDATVHEALIHLYGHLNYHLGQINYLRRILEEKG